MPLRWWYAFPLIENLQFEVILELFLDEPGKRSFLIGVQRPIGDKPHRYPLEIVVAALLLQK